MKRNALLGAIVISTVGAAVFAHNGATGLVLERMNGMTAMRSVMRDLAPMMQGSAPFDIRVVQTAGATLMAHSGDNMNNLFPQDEVPAASYAKDEIWTDWEKFAALSTDLRTYAMGLAVAAPNGLTTPGITDTAAVQDGMADDMAMQMDQPDEILSVAELMGVMPRGNSIGSGMMMSGGQNSQNGTTTDFETFAADDVFEKISQTCASCHALFRRGN